MGTWYALTGRTRYRAVDDETFELDDQDFLARPWPFCSSDPVVVGHYFGAVAAIMTLIGAKPPARIVEFGAGWGHLSLHLAATGFRVSAVDLNPPSVALLRRRASLLGVDLNVVEGSFLDFEPDGPIDTFVFFESFHHCEAPFELLDRCTRQLAVGGRILFAADGIYDDFRAPWGVRLDDEAALMTARHGWLELGFFRPFLEGEIAQSRLRRHLGSSPRTRSLRNLPDRRAPVTLAMGIGGAGSRASFLRTQLRGESARPRERRRSGRLPCPFFIDGAHQEHQASPGPDGTVTARRTRAECCRGLET